MRGGIAGCAGLHGRASSRVSRRSTIARSCATSAVPPLRTKCPNSWTSWRAATFWCEVIAKRLGLGPGVIDGLTHASERWDGVSTEKLAEGEQVSRPMRVVQAAYQAGQDSQHRGATEIGERVRTRAGKQLDRASQQCSQKTQHISSRASKTRT